MPSETPYPNWDEGDRLIAEGDEMFNNRKYAAAAALYRAAMRQMPRSSGLHKRARFYARQAELELSDPNPSWWRRFHRDLNRMFWEVQNTTFNLPSNN